MVRHIIKAISGFRILLSKLIQYSPYAPLFFKYGQSLRFLLGQHINIFFVFLCSVSRSITVPDGESRLLNFPCRTAF